MPPRTRATRIVVSTRAVKYPFRSNANRLVRTNDAGRRKVSLLDDPGGTGRQTVREIVACPSCAKQR